MQNIKKEVTSQTITSYLRSVEGSDNYYLLNGFLALSQKVFNRLMGVLINNDSKLEDFKDVIINDYEFTNKLNSIETNTEKLVENKKSFTEFIGEESALINQKKMFISGVFSVEDINSEDFGNLIIARNQLVSNYVTNVEIDSYSDDPNVFRRYSELSSRFNQVAMGDVYLSDKVTSLFDKIEDLSISDKLQLQVNELNRAFNTLEFFVSSNETPATILKGGFIKEVMSGTFEYGSPKVWEKVLMDKFITPAAIMMEERNWSELQVGLRMLTDVAKDDFEKLYACRNDFIDTFWEKQVVHYYIQSLPTFARPDLIKEEIAAVKTEIIEIQEFLSISKEIMTILSSALKLKLKP